MLAGGCWLTASEIAELRLIGLPADKRALNEVISQQRWADRRSPEGLPLFRQRKGRGGGFEWHSSVLPERARQQLVRLGKIAAPIAETAKVVALQTGSSAAWAMFEALPDTRKAEARRRLAVIDAVEALRTAGTTKTRAIAVAAADAGVSIATVHNWFSLIAGIARSDRLAHLVPAIKGGGREAEIDREMWDLYRSSYLSPSRLTHATCYWYVERTAKDRGISIPSAKTFQRKFDRETPPEVILATREGRDRIAQIVPAQRRSVASMHALHTVNIDGHRWDVRVEWPDGSVERPVMIGIQDVYSRKLLAWRVDKVENAITTRLAIADMLRDYGIPVGFLLDNGRAFASKWISGGAETRYRFKAKADEPLGLLTQLGIRMHWATPYHGQAKPIERYWRDVCEKISRGPWFNGAYLGSNPNAKPHNYGSRVIPLAEFLKVIDRELRALNAKLGRRSEMANGGSFDQAFERSINAGAPVGRATPEQMRLALLTAERVVADRKSGAINFLGNRYWAEGMLAYAGQRLTIRFDPDDLHTSLWAYDVRGALIAELPVLEATGFLDVDAAKRWSKQQADVRKKVRAAVEAQQLLEAAEIERVMAGLSADAPAPLQPKVVRPVRTRSTATAVKAAPADDILARFGAGLAADEQRNSRRLRLVE